MMEDSTTYQEILEKGMTQGLSQGQRAVLLRQGTKRFGPPPASIATALQAITDPTQLEHLEERILDAVDWDDLLKIN